MYTNTVDNLIILYYHLLIYLLSCVHIRVCFNNFKFVFNNNNISCVFLNIDFVLFQYKKTQYINLYRSATIGLHGKLNTRSFI